MVEQVRRQAACLLVILCLLTVSSAAFALGEIGDVNPDGVAKLSVNALTAMIAKKDAIAGAQKIIRKTFDDEWTWNYVIGNYEKMIFQNAEAEIPKFNKKINGMIGDVQGVIDVSLRIYEGNYDEAAFKVLDIAVGKMGHPIVSLTWEGVKLCYESHKEVVATGVALDIERLYGIVNNDRRLVGISADDAQPKLIPVTRQNADYFFNKYLIVNDGVRALMKSYVTKKLGEKFPEDVFIVAVMGDLITGEDTQRAKEIEKISQHKEDGIRWTVALLNDLNNQVKVEWAKTRLRKNVAEIQEFLRKFKGITDERMLADLLADMKNQKAYKEDAEKYPKLLDESKKERERVKNAVEKLKPTEAARAQEFTSLAMDWHHKLRQASARAFKINKMQLSEDLEKEMYDWDRFREFLSEKYKEKTASIGDEAFKEIYATISTNPTYALIDDTYSALFKPLLKPYPWPVDPEKVKEQLLDSLQRGRFDKAQEIIYKWKNFTMAETAEGSLWEYYNKLSKEMYDLWVATRKPLAEELARVEQTCRAIVDATQWNACWKGSYEPLYKRVVGLDGAVTFSQCTYGYPQCAMSSLSSAQYTLFAGTSEWLQNTYNAFEELSSQRQLELEELRKGLASLSKALPFPPADKPLEVEQLEKDLANVKENAWVAVTKGWMDREKVGNVGNIVALMQQKAYELDQWQYLADSIRAYEAVVSGLELKWSIGAKEAQAFLNGVRFNEEEYNQFTVLADQSFSKEEVERYRRIVSQVPSVISGLKETFRQFMVLGDTQLTNTSRDADWLKGLAKELTQWLNAKVKTGILTTYSGTWTVNVAGQERMAATSVPYPHYLTKEEADKLAKEGKELKAYSFIRNYMPTSLPVYENLISCAGVPLAEGENFMLPDKTIIYRSALDTADPLVAALRPDEEREYLYQERLKAIAAVLPRTVDIADYVEEQRRRNVAQMLGTAYVPIPQQGRLIPMDTSTLTFPLGVTYTELRTKIETAMRERVDYLKKARERASEEAKRQAEFDAKYGTVMNKIGRGIGMGNEQMARGEYQSVVGLWYYLDQVKAEYKAIGSTHGEVDKALSQLAALIETAKTRLKETESQSAAIIQEFYRKFKEAYESRNDSAVCSLISNNWLSGDGTTISDLQANLRRTFRVFDEVKYTIQNMNIQRQPDGCYRVDYEVTITSRIYKRNLTHEEKSKVSEELTIDASGKPKISRTLGGVFWYTK